MAVQRIKLERQSMGQTDWGYINARIRGMKSRLLSREKMEDLLKQSEVDAVLDQLRDTPYGFFVEEAQQKYQVGISRVEVIGWALKSNMSQTIERLRKLMGEKPAEMLDFLLEKWDVYNIKTILRGKHSKILPAQISQNMFPIGKLSEEQLYKLSQDPEIDVKDVVDAFVNFCNASHKDKKLVDEAWGSFSSTGNLLELELALDSLFYKGYLKKVDGFDNEGKLEYIVKLGIDISNVMMVFRLVKAKVEETHINKFFIKGGKRINKAMFASLAAEKDIEEVINRLTELDFYGVILDRMPLYKKLFDVSIFERAVSGFLLSRIKAVFRVDVFGIGVLVSYLEQKFNEIINLRIIIRSKEFGMPDEIVRGELIFV